MRLTLFYGFVKAHHILYGSKESDNQNAYFYTEACYTNFSAVWFVIQTHRRSQTPSAWWLPPRWWRNKLETFSALLALCEGNTSVTSGSPSQRPVTRSFDVFFDLHLTKRLCKQSRCRWFEMPSCSLWCHCEVPPVPPVSMKIGNSQSFPMCLASCRLSYI